MAIVQPFQQEHFTSMANGNTVTQDIPARGEMFIVVKNVSPFWLKVYDDKSVTLAIVEPFKNQPFFCQKESMRLYVENETALPVAATEMGFLSSHIPIPM